MHNLNKKKLKKKYIQQIRKEENQCSHLLPYKKVKLPEEIPKP